MTVQWLTAFIDHPADVAGAQVRFWQLITDSALSTRRGPRGQFATMVPSRGDAYLRVQETDDGSAGVHIDLHVDSVGDDVRRAIEFGAVLFEQADDDLAILHSPTGLRFCIVRHRGEVVRSDCVQTPGQDAPHVFDQISIDIPHNAFADECNFWSAFTGWALHGGSVPEFRVLERPDGMALRVLFQRLGEDDTGATARAHLDAAVGNNGEAIAKWHESLGATIASRGRRWITLTDPAGLGYCLTERDPVTGTL